MSNYSSQSFHCSWYAENSVIVRVPSQYTPNSVRSFLQPFFPETKIVVGLDSLVVQNSHHNASLCHELELALTRYTQNTEEHYRNEKESSIIEIPTKYDGEDISRISELLNVSEEELVKAHVETLWEVALLGFVPGFGYLVPFNSPVDWWAKIPRLSTPRGKVPKGSVAVAAGMSAIYPNSMPGGWSLLGHTNVQLFDPTNIQSPTLFISGDRIRFVHKNDLAGEEQ